MSTFTAEFPHLAHQVSDLDVDQLIAEATKFSTNFQPWVVFISSADLNKKFGHHLIHPVYCCKSMHDFLKIGLDRHGCVIVVDENRAECSTLHLRELLISRTTQPFEIIPYSQTNEHQLLNEIKNSLPAGYAFNFPGKNNQSYRPKDSLIKSQSLHRLGLQPQIL